MKILVTGGTGLIGRNLLKRIEGDITVVSRSHYKLKKLKEEFPKIRIIVGDISEEKFVKRIVRNQNIIYHLAAMRAVSIAENDIEGCIHINVISIINLLKYFRGQRFVTLSSDKAVTVSSVYGATKFIVERLVTFYASNNADNTRYLIIRSGNVFGSVDSVMSRWKDLLERKQPIEITDPTATRYFCTVDQVIDSILKPDYQCRKLIRCLDLKSVSLKTLLSAMQKKYGKAVMIRTIGRQLGENKHEKLRRDGLSSDKANKYTLKELLKLV